MKIRINTQEKGAPLQDLYGIFFEDINHAADGGLYAELVRNRSFEFDHIDNKDYHSLTAWERIGKEDRLEIKVETDRPCSRKNPHYLALNRLTADGEAGIMNLGYNTGIYLKEGERYRLTFLGASESGKAIHVSISLCSQDGEIYDSTEFTIEQKEWSKYSCEFKAAMTDTSARLAIVPMAAGKVLIDMVSLFPVNTYLKRENGLRADIAQLLADMKPRFMRFPGGCLTHDGSFDKDAKDQMYDWKNTVGKLEERPSRRNNWRYNQTFGLGFYEYFQFCEDIKAKPIPVISPGFDPHHKRAVPIGELGPWIQDALDLIEFANGDATTPYGKLRADMGHPEPFGLEYLGIGNEEVDDEFFERYEYFHRAIKEKYPDIKLINSSGPFPAGFEYEKGWANARRNQSDLVDEHYYTSPQWLIANHHRYDGFDPNGPKVFVGEYASHGNTMFNALAEASYMIGLERNAAAVALACYAPLLCNVDYRNWFPNLIYYNNHQVYASANYYVQKLFMNHQGEYLLKLEKEGMEPASLPKCPINGGIVLHNYWSSDVTYSDITVTNDDTKEVSQCPDIHCFGEEKDKELCSVGSSNWTLRMKARENEEGHAFRIDFGITSDRDRYEWIIGGWANVDDMINEVIDGSGTIVSQRQFIRGKKEFDLCLKVRGRVIETYVDGQLTNRAECLEYVPEPIYCSATVDQNGDIILKGVNVTEKPAKVQISLEGVKGALEGCSYVMAGYPLDAKNSFENPDHVKPKVNPVRFEDSDFTYEFPEYSITVLRLKAK